MKKIVNIITLGCSKNLVDSEKLLKQLEANNYKVIHDSNKKSDIIIINTCGFINDAKQESIDTILSAIEAKRSGKVEKVFVFGCLSERYADELRAELPEVNQYFGTFDLEKVIRSLNAEYKEDLINERIVTTPQHVAYLKISDGCNHTCAFCAIPAIKGKYTSRTIEDIVDEAQRLINQGVKECILIAQDISYYGVDIYGKCMLPQLVDKLSALEGMQWLRLHYAYPNNFPEEVLDLMAQRSNICKYLDIPLQHITDNMLKTMKRNISGKRVKELITKIRTKVPDIALRTTLIVGHPGEEEADFNDLLDFVKETKFDRLGVFTYSEEDGTYSALNYKDNITEEEKQRRADEIMFAQQDISLELNQNKIGKTFKTIIDRKEGEAYIGRTEFDSFEVDNEVIIETDQKLIIGEFYNVKIVKAEDFDIYGLLES